MDHINVTSWRYEYMHTAMRYWIYRNSKLVCSTDREDDARRIVACVNACAGIETEELEFLIRQQTSILDGMGALRSDHSRLQKANLDLLNVIRELSMIVHRITEQDIADTMPDEPVFK